MKVRKFNYGRYIDEDGNMCNGLGVLKEPTKFEPFFYFLNRKIKPFPFFSDFGIKKRF